MLQGVEKLTSGCAESESALWDECTTGEDCEEREICRRETFSPRPEDDVDPIWFVLK